MKHIVYVITIMITIPTIAMATDVDIEPGANATCDNGTLRTTEGDVNLRAEWTANTITLNYYNGGNTPYISNTCSYGGGITLPDVPSRPGYSFMGWKLRMFDLTTLADYVDTGGNHFWAVGHGSLYDMLCFDNDYEQPYWAEQNCSDSSFPIDELTEYTDWKVEFSYGTVRGTARCSNYAADYEIGANLWDFTHYPDNATWDQTLVTDDWETGGYCWCHITGFDDGNQGSYVSVKAPWILYTKKTVDKCMENCAESCAEDLKNQSKTVFRQAMFGINVPEQ